MSIWEITGIVCVILSAFITFVLYCCILVGADADRRMRMKEEKSEETDDSCR